VYDGNTSNTFGTGRAVIDGSEPLAGWTACLSAEDCGGNTNWGSLFKAAMGTNDSVFTANMYEDDQMLWPAQDPNVTDPFFPDNLAAYIPINSDQVTRTSLTDTNTFTQADPNHYRGCYLRLWGNPNVVRIIPITGYVPGEHKITFADTGANSLYSDTTVYYALVNHLSDLDSPGEFAVNRDTGTASLWPRTAGDPNTNGLTHSVRRRGIYINGQSHLHIRGFSIQKMTSGAGEYSMGCAIVDRLGGSNIAISDNEITRNYSQENEGAIRMYGTATIGTNILIEGNRIFENPHNSGILATIHDSIVRNNTLHTNGATSIDFYACARSQMLGNTVAGGQGVHANGLTLYLGCRDCTVAGNTVSDGRIALTTQSATNILVAYNILHTAEDAYTAIDWGSAADPSTGIRNFNNVLINSYGKALGMTSTGTYNLVVRNNILDGCLAPPGSNVSHNIYTSLSWRQSVQYGWQPGEGEFIQTNKSLLFIDPAGRDPRLRGGSPAIDAGVEIGLTADHSGQSVPADGGPDIGAYEYWISLADTDGDELSDLWELQHYGGVTNANPSDPAANAEYTIYETYVAGLNPTNPLSAFALSAPPAAMPALRWDAVSGRVYSVFWTTNLLAGFQPVQTNLPWTQTAWTDLVHGTEARSFYRISIGL
jgi:hypothetical protein